MMPFLFFVFVALTFTGWIMLVWAAGSAPTGTEDETGFHLAPCGLEIDVAGRGDAPMSVFLRKVLDREFAPTA